ncbi:DUF4236 domain-containing protein [Arthrospiribacter ruber]|uniref:DUF4236 domain-containing protein n=1 Tax=Arthrospiribacter ruber TaxID=2487934 RepID=A0A951IYC6_9BACT|nr:DUF4236 domain-containing protein [Arthrospiribacter ruber]MBW3469485.1 DUF4236 domain-containing protein [Arthrospiribacter ruber]
MAFYLRKGFNFGPLRVNLSKSGLGFSAGVKGARIGINSQGRSYVHGGRHGMYYRKNIGSVKGTPTSHQPTGSKLKEEEIFTDTGLTYKPVTDLSRAPFSFPDIFRKTNPILMWSGILLIIFSLLISNLSVKLVVAILGLILLVFYNKKRNKRNQLELAFEALRNLKPLEQNQASWEMHSSDLDSESKKDLALLVFNCWLEKQMTEGEILYSSTLMDFLLIEPDNLQSITLEQYREAVEFVLADHQLSYAEEQLIRQMEERWKIPPKTVEAEHRLIAKFAELRKMQMEDLKPILLGRPPIGKEQGYFEGEGKLLNLRVLDTYQENKLRYKTVGYQVDMEGTLRITDRVIEIVEGRNSRTYPINRVEDIFLNVAEGVVEVNIKGRKNPLIFTTPEIFTFAGILQKCTMN